MSLEQKIKRNLFLAWYLGYRKDCQNNLVWSLIDFGYGRFDSIMSGRCSLQASMDFDIEAFEMEVNEDFKALAMLLMGANKRR